MRVADFDFDLPDELIAQFPPAVRGGSRLLHVGTAGSLYDGWFSELPALLRPNDLLVMNDTRVIKARLFGTKDSGGKVELMVERVLDEHDALAFIRASHAPRPGSRIRLADDMAVEVLARQDDLTRLHFSRPVLAVLEQFGKLPLPPYIEHPPTADDEARYQTVYANEPGAVAAPTAGLHFDDAMLDALREKGVRTAWVTLHVGAGTFQPVRVEAIADHRMHSERYTIPQASIDAIRETRARGARIVAVGTTSLRALEAAALSSSDGAGTLQAGAGETDIFITPGYRFRVVDALITNFHLPRSTLLMLVSAFAGVDAIRAAYAHAIRERYRFFSYGDAMFLEKNSLEKSSPERNPR
ncbi:MAG: tRNA preQ1(34) S-adenosylmethionine ribosyltransferase-isomerase QueA [Thiobacillus sp.]|jgi:S-adenosylmethionine:tRNA ribosyltransferase-isomerase|uniref:tRNA preQ1(34) S-adenosylmethionine ribosyltransferase-isomerase QueA n=1 Tax=Thiobacillus sp. TaxID=924 RepID=UPI00289424F4|nr:tRNA preQ1(34) S-adenosylmethionine ribosyltransferase-isomerase QueA [Thiobacillus sp.]MDT3705323.1 tRNA preQ1(34) S-adenosylmethionine ribosyltransferase-isomerase QueA [Thiobacillus sp.]